MSRATVTKSRADKGKPPAAQTPIISHEIVPGKFNDHDWNMMLEHDNSEEFIIDMLETVVNNAMNVIQDHYIESQLLPFTITQAKDAILQIVEWQFLARDDGEEEAISDPGWLQDEEPDPAITDCWAQGAVPKSYLALTTQTIEEEPLAEEEETLVAEEKISEEPIVVEEEEPELADKVSDTEESTQPPEPESKEEIQTKPDQVVEKKKKKFKPYHGKMKSAGVRRMSESLEESEMKSYMEMMGTALPGSGDLSSDRLKMPASCQSLLKVQAGRPPGTKEVDYDEMGNVVSVIKLDPEKLPNHRVKVKYQVIDPSVEAAKVRLEAMRHGKYITPTLQRMEGSRRKRSESSEAASTARSTRTCKGSQQPTITSLPPPLIEAMEIAPGVIVKEGSRVKKGPGRHISSNTTQNMIEDEHSFISEELKAVFHIEMRKALMTLNINRQFDELKTELCDLRQENEYMKKKIDQLENNSRRENLLFFGIPEQKPGAFETWEDCETLVRKILLDNLSMEEVTIGIDRAHRLNTRSRPRPILVKFSNFKDKTRVWAKFRDCEKESDFDFRVSEDFSARVRHARKRLTPFLVTARKKRKRVNMKYDKLFMDGRFYGYNRKTGCVEPLKSQTGLGKSEMSVSSVLSGVSQEHRLPVQT